ncbi:hypothetical protein HC891_03785, partial [Candidatus Gracilibacteria bacterium]|nr:hypothetical protein [Candidatus Gracilibacteria bacterium]
MIAQVDELLRLIVKLQADIRDTVVAACEQSAIEDLSGVAEDEQAGDTIYTVDRVSEAVLVAFFREHVAPRWPLCARCRGRPRWHAGFCPNAAA